MEKAEDINASERLKILSPSAVGEMLRLHDNVNVIRNARTMREERSREKMMCYLSSVELHPRVDV